MPVLEIRALPQKAGVDVSAAIRKVCCEVAVAGDLPKHQVWATWETISPGYYAEGDSAVDVQPDATHPPIVNLIAFEGRPDDVVKKMISAAAIILAMELQLEPGNIFLTYTEAKSGRVYTGGEIRYLQR